MIVAMRSGLAKLPPARRPLLFRAEKVGRKGIETYLKRFPEGNAISPGGFMATTPHHDRILKGSVSIVVDGNAGRWIGPLSAYPEQDEVLFDSAAAFMVDQVMKTEHGAVVWLRQL
ncbi:hypothetical protein [Oceanicella actignis]|uniref:hypothetical protein n=1 Tax=Oceanicella actignis TaxID=1189325 RepID=UPI000F74A2C9|nr:hypothetical protein [Oceanicella actignis]